jgi:hypothetical protein
MSSSFRHWACTAGIAGVMLASAAAAQSAPVILSVTTTGTPGQSFGLIITGTGFGSGPKKVSYPYFGDTKYFLFIDKHPINDGPGTRRSGYVSWDAGFQNAKVSDPVTLDYMVWNDTEIQFCGFYGDYGQNGWIMTSGDKFEIKIMGPDGSGKVIYVGTVP